MTGEASGKSGGVDGAAGRLAAHERYEHRRVNVQLRRAQAEHALEEALTRTPAEAALYSRWLKAGGPLFEKADELDATGAPLRRGPDPRRRRLLRTPRLPD